MANIADSWPCLLIYHLAWIRISSAFYISPQTTSWIVAVEIIKTIRDQNNELKCFPEIITIYNWRPFNFPHFWYFMTHCRVSEEIFYSLICVYWKVPPAGRWAPVYLLDESPRRRLSSASSVYVVPRTRIKLGDRAVSVAGPIVWNSLQEAKMKLSLSVRDADTVTRFKRPVKTLFSLLE